LGRRDHRPHADVSSDAWSISKLPSTVSSRRQTMIPGRSPGQQIQTKSSPL
jgi:hypothetical protein